ncbi:MAG: C40 family peptidase [Bacteroides sp.]|nr:C40 family peptidase [Bacteroides sp.]MCM1445692.1 C40 family peptidase [Prevotella sp.]
MAALQCSAATAVITDSYALVRLSVAPMRDKPDHAAEQISQALMGTPVKVLQKTPEWSRVQTPDGYIGWIINHSLVPFKSEQDYENWLNKPKVMITEPYEQHDRDRRTDLVAGIVLVVEGDSLALPDGRKIFKPEGVTALEDFGEFRPEFLPRFAELYMGSPYLWGGLSSKGMDCSGLVRMAYMSQGRITRRDARDQVFEGAEVPVDSLQAGDLLYFGNPETGRITHVAIYDHDGEYVHSSQLVKRNSLDPQSPIYLPIKLLHCRRINGTPILQFFTPKSQKKP